MKKTHNLWVSRPQMKTKLRVLALFCAVPLTASAQTADEVVKKYVEARGGAARLKAVQSERISGRIFFAPGVEGSFFIEFKRPLKMHMEANIQGQTLVRVYDGKSSGWIINPFGPSKDVQPMSADDLKSIADESDFDGPLFEYQAKGNQIELAGKDELEGKPVYKVKLTQKTGTRTYYIDASSFLVLKWEGLTKQEDQEIAIQNLLSDYRDVDGLKFPFEMDTSSPTAPQQRQFLIDKIEINPQIDDARFSKPAPPESPANPASTPPANPPTEQESSFF
jgi:outer membrane lipoprotein-sorting protein